MSTGSDFFFCFCFFRDPRARTDLFPFYPGLAFSAPPYPLFLSLMAPLRKKKREKNNYSKMPKVDQRKMNRDFRPVRTRVRVYVCICVFCAALFIERHAKKSRGKKRLSKCSGLDVIRFTPHLEEWPLPSSSRPIEFRTASYFLSVVVFRCCYLLSSWTLIGEQPNQQNDRRAHTHAHIHLHMPTRKKSSPERSQGFVRSAILKVTLYEIVSPSSLLRQSKKTRPLQDAHAIRNICLSAGSFNKLMLSRFF